MASGRDFQTKCNPWLTKVTFSLLFERLARLELKVSLMAASTSGAMAILQSRHIPVQSIEVSNMHRLFEIIFYSYTHCFPQ